MLDSAPASSWPVASVYPPDKPSPFCGQPFLWTGFLYLSSPVHVDSLIFVSKGIYIHIYLAPFSGLADKQVSYCKWIHFYRSYFHGTKMMSVNKNAFRLGKHSGVSLPDCQCCSLYGKRFEIRGFGGCIFASTVICTESMGHCMFIVSLLYGCPSYYFLLVWVLILHICKQLCTYAAVVPQRPYAFPFQGKIPWRILTGYHHKKYIVVPKIKIKKDWLSCCHWVITELGPKWI